MGDPDLYTARSDCRGLACAGADLELRTFTEKPMTRLCLKARFMKVPRLCKGADCCSDVHRTVYKPPAPGVDAWHGSVIYCIHMEVVSDVRSSSAK